MDRYTDNEIAFIIQKKEQTDLEWPEITKKYNKKFRKDRDFECIKKCYQRYKNFFNEDDNHIRTLKTIHRTRKSNSYTAKENRTILQHWNDRDDLLESIKEVVTEVKLNKYKVPKAPKRSRKKDNMTKELLVSDVHFGKMVKDRDGEVVVDNNIIIKRIRKVANQTIKDIQRDSHDFNVERLVMAFIGDMVESSIMHGVESLKSCEFGTSKQIFEAIRILYSELLLPIASTGIQIDCSCVSGNHDRPDIKKTYINPGEEYFTYVIYKTLQMLCEESGLDNVSFDITSKMYNHYKIYDDIVVIEHGDELKNPNRETVKNLMNKRQNQIGQIVNFYRTGHWHEHFSYGQGRMQGNGSIPGQDDYSEGKGFDSEALQILNSYVQTNKRKTSFFKSFPIYLEEK